MRFKIDENLPSDVAEVLQQAGHNAITVVEQDRSGCTDLELATLCQHESRALVTLDLDFADIRHYPPSEFPGLVVLRLGQQDKPYVLDVVSRLIQVLQLETLESRLWIVEESRIRIRE
ncbi:MAG: DUF5615 family PIN-like protein [Anaerolineae bacterium]|jgi:predicted nuclease of predicted toxin-antitoxin system